MKKLIIIGTLLLSLLVGTVVAAITQTFAAPEVTSINLYGTGGRVGFSVPKPGGNLAPGFPTYFNLYFWDLDKRSEPGAFDMLNIMAWAPGINYTITVGLVVDIPVTNWMKKYYNGTALYLETSAGVVRNNIFQVTDAQLEVQAEQSSSQSGNGRWSWDEYGRYVWGASDNILNANLTVPVQITKLPAQFGLPDFTVDPMSVGFYEIAEGTYHEGAYFVYPGKIPTVKGTSSPVIFSAITAGAGWGRGAPIEAIGSMYAPGTITYTLPP